MGTPSAEKTKDKEDRIIYRSVTRDVRVYLSRYIVTLNALGFPPSAEKTKDKEDRIIYRSVTRDVRVYLSRYIVTLNALGFPPLLAPPLPPPPPPPPLLLVPLGPLELRMEVPKSDLHSAGSLSGTEQQYASYTLIHHVGARAGVCLPPLFVDAAPRHGGYPPV